MGETVDKISESERLTEIVWCDHVSVVPHPLVPSPVPHFYIKQPVYLVVEERKIKLICPQCWIVNFCG